MARRLVSYKKVKCVTGDKWLGILEKKAFGWYYWSMETVDDPSLKINDDGRLDPIHHYFKRVEFRRPSPYSNNLLFNLTELLDKIFSSIRRILISIGLPIFVIAIILGIVGTSACNDASLSDMSFSVAEAIAISYICCIVGTLILSGLGIMWRRVFKIDEKLKAVLGDDLESACYFKDE